MLKKVVFIGAIILIGIVLASCTGNQNIANPFPYGDDSMLDPSVTHPIVDQFAYMPYDKMPYIPWDDFVYFPWDDFAYIPWEELPYLPWENLNYQPWDLYPYFPWDDLPYFPWDEVPYLPGDDVPYLYEIPEWIKTLTPPWQFIDIGCPNLKTVAMTFRTDLMDSPSIRAEDCNSKYTCVPIDGKPGWYYCTASKSNYSYKNCPIKICVQLGKELVCQELDPGVSIDCPNEIKPTPVTDQGPTPTPVPGINCSTYDEKNCPVNICRVLNHICVKP
jgi:hypothetical protein